MSTNMDDARETARTITRRYVEITHPGAEGRDAALARCSIATAQAEALRRDPFFGPDHPDVAAYMGIATEAALEATPIDEIGAKVSLWVDVFPLDLH